MGKPTGFKEITRETPQRRPVELRVLDWDEIYNDFPDDKLRAQGARCMDCGIPFCNNGCPLGNIIPEWNDLVYRNPNFKLDKKVVERRIRLMEAEGVTFKTNANVGENVTVEDLRRDFDAIVLCGGATHARDINVPGRDLKGIYKAMEYLPLQNK